MNRLPATFVVLADSFNPSIFSQSWLTKWELAKDAFGEISLSSPAVSQHEIGPLALLVVPDRFQVTFPPENDAAAEKARHLVRGTVERLPHTPFRALGMNLNYEVEIPKERFHVVLASMFLCHENPLADDFSGNDATFGGYMCRDFKMLRLRLDVKPRDYPEDASSLRFNVNFHRELARDDRDEAITQIREAIDAWHECRVFADCLVAKIERYAAAAPLPPAV